MSGLIAITMRCDMKKYGRIWTAILFGIMGIVCGAINPAKAAPEAPNIRTVEAIGQSAPAGPALATVKPAFRFLAIADPHFEYDPAKNQQERLDRFKDFLESTKSLSVDFVVILGDITRDCPPTLAMAKQIAAESDVQVHFVRGNHDDRAAYLKTFDKLNYSFDHKGSHVVIGGGVEADWLKKDLAGIPTNRPVIFCQHLLPGIEISGVLEKYPLALALSGHVHSHRHGMTGKLRDINIPAFDSKDGFEVIDVMTDGSISIAWRPQNVSRLLVVVHPADGAEVAPGGTSLRVNAFDSGREVLQVEYNSGAGWQPMTRDTYWSWSARTELQGGSLQVRATDSANAVWIVTNAYHTGAPAPMIKLGADWPVRGGTPDNRRAAADRLTPPLRLAWSTAIGGGYCTQPVLAGGRLFIAICSQDYEKNNALVCLDAVSGKELWRASLENSLLAPAAVVADVVGVFDQFGHAYGFDAKTGRQLWRLDDISGAYGGGWGESGMITAAAEVFYVGNLHALAAASGRQLWQAPVAGRPIRPPAVAGGRVLGAGIERQMCLDAKTGALLWTCASGTVYRAAIFLGETALLDNFVVRAADGGRLRRCGRSGEIDCAASADGKLLLVPGKQLTLVSLADDKVLWETKEERSNLCGSFAGGWPSRLLFGYSAPVISGDFAWVATGDGSVRALSIQDGKEVWRFGIGAFLEAPIVSGNALFVAGYDGCVYALAGAGTGEN